ncbi:type IV secretory system conjugative DNA transfer family protein [Dactylosporangium sp. CA-233914]|uniref:type IV secretory system conjugative DNA transfer family protein n=1 Tax=Dactylosporangium sp. CA-233914 TaxID=3239934 RepID=UPI003D91322C
MSGVGELGPKAIRLGRIDQGKDGAGFVAADGDLHVLTLAPNRSDRVRHCLTPNLLTYPGRIAVIDLGGEAYAATAEARRRMGHTVVRLDPFGVAGPGSDALDPIDLLHDLEDPALSSACQDLADLFPLRTPSGEAAEYEAFGLLSGLIGYLAAIPEKHSFDELYPTMHSDDVVYSLAVVLDTAGKLIPKMSYAEIASFLDQDDRARNRVLARVRSQLPTFGNPEVRATLRSSSFSLSGLAAGDPITVYLILPVERLALHAALLRVWIGTLLHGVLRQRGGSALPMLFLLDHCAELGPFPLLESVLRMAPLDACRVWTFWHDAHQLRTTNPGSWPAIVSGCEAVQVFGTTDTAAAAEADDLLGLRSNKVGSLGPGEQLIRLGAAVHRARKIGPRDTD